VTPRLGIFVAAGLMLAPGSARLRPQTAVRDTPAQQREAARSDSGRIAGRVIGADTGRPVARALVRLSAGELPGERSALTDTSGAFEFTDLPAGRYTLSASKAGYVRLSFGQRRPLQAGTPLQLVGGQALKGVDFRLPRGSAITGHLYDENGDPLPGATVVAARYQYAQGLRQLVSAGTAQTDDRGEYRVWGLNPGEYFVSALARNPQASPRGGFAFSGPGGAGGFFGRGRGAPPGPPGSDALQVEAYAPTYFPGVPSANEARVVSVSLGAEAAGIDFRVLLVRASRLTGRVTHADGSLATGGSVNLIPEAAMGRVRGRLGGRYGARIQGDGAFSIVNVPPGRYSLRARGEEPPMRGSEYVPPEFASLPLTVDGDIEGLTVALAPGARITGTVTFRATRSDSAPQSSQFRILASLTDGSETGPSSTARIESDGTFLLVGIPAGSLWLRARTPDGWSLESTVVNGRETIDAPFEIETGDELTGVAVTFGDRQSEITGTLADTYGLPVTEYTVLAFPTDSTLWRPQARQILTARPDQTGQFRLRGLPPGDYYLVAIDPVEQGEWFEPAFLDERRRGATRVRLGEGDSRRQDLSVRSAR
jgi:hypothetical protein